MRRSLFFLFCTTLSIGLGAQSTWAGYAITCATRDTAAGAYQSAPVDFLNGSAVLETKFDLRFADSVPPVAEASMTFAANVWGSYLQSTVPIRVNIDWRDRGDERLLASAGPATLFRDFRGGRDNTWYPVALAEAIVGEELNDEENADINVIVNSTADWYFGIDGRTPRSQIDLATVFMHELGHGLGFLSSIDSISPTELGLGFDGRFIIYDVFLETPNGIPLTDTSMFGTPSADLLMAVAEELIFAGEEARNRNGDADVPLFAPETFDVGSSISHLEERVYRAGSENALMTPFVAAGEAVHDPGPVTLGIFSDLGWPLRFDLTGTRAPAIARLPVYPNPASGSFTIPLSGVTAPTVAVLYAADGREVRRQPLGHGVTSVNFSVARLPPGHYTLWVPGSDRISRSRVVVR